MIVAVEREVAALWREDLRVAGERCQRTVRLCEGERRDSADERDDEAVVQPEAVLRARWATP